MPPAHRVDRRTTPGRRPGARAGTWQRRVVLGGGVLTAMAAWLVLVAQAIAFGQNAGSTLSWVLLGLATLGAIACMFLAILLATRLVGLWRSPDAPTRPSTLPAPPTTPIATTEPQRRTVRQAVAPTPPAPGPPQTPEPTDPTAQVQTPARPPAQPGSHTGGPRQGLRALRRRLPARPRRRRTGRDD